MHCSYILFQLFNRYIGRFLAHDHTELIPGSYLIVFLSEESFFLESLDTESNFENINFQSSNLEKVLSFISANAQDVEIISSVLDLEREDLNAYIEARHGVNVFNSQDLNQCSDEPVLYFFPRRVFKLKKVIPPSPAQ